MGEGKTTMITPLVVLLLADGTRHLLGGVACSEGQELESPGTVLITVTEASQTKVQDYARLQREVVSISLQRVRARNYKHLPEDSLNMQYWIRRRPAS